MQNPSNVQVSAAPQVEPVEPARQAWHDEVSKFLAQAAALCIQHGVEVDTFMSGAWSAYVEARPGMRAEIEEMQLRDQLDELRKAGRVGVA